MDGKDKIIGRILDDAAAYRQDVMTKADEDYDSVLNDAKSRVEAAEQKLKDELEKEETETLKRSEVVAGLDGRKLYLKRKTEAVGEVFSAALEKLNKLDKSAYKSLIMRLIEENAVVGATVVLAENSPLTAREVSDACTQQGINVKVNEGGKFSGGIFIVTDGADINLSFEALVASAKEKYETFVAEKLFD